MEYGELSVGQRVELHPATDLWMRGARYGEIVELRPNGGARGVAVVQLDRTGKRVRMLPDELLQHV